MEAPPASGHARRRSTVDDGSATLSQHDLQAILAAEEEAGEVDIQCSPPSFEIETMDLSIRIDQLHPRAIEQNIKSSVSICNRLECGGDSRFFGHVRTEG